MLKDTGKVALRPVAAETLTSKSESPQARFDAPAERPVAPDKKPSDAPAQRRTAPDETPSDTPAERPPPRPRRHRSLGLGAGCVGHCSRCFRSR